MIIKNSQLSGFFDKTELQFVGQYLNYTFATNDQLEAMTANGLITYNEMYPPDVSFLNKVGKVGAIAAVVVVAAGAAAFAYSGVAVATAPAVGQATAISNSISSSWAFKSMQTVSSVVTGAGAIYSKLTGEPPSEKLQKAADIFNSENVTDTIKKGVDFQLKQQNIKLDPDNKEANAALNERIKREQEEYAGQLRKLAEDQREYDHVEPKQKPGLLNVAAVATPFLLFFMGK